MNMTVTTGSPSTGSGNHPVVSIGPATGSDWLDAAGRSPHTTAEQSPEWVAAMTGHGRAGDATRAYRFADGRLAVLPLVRRGVGPAASLWSPLPAWGIGGLIGDVDEETVAAVTRDLASLPVLRVSVRIDEWQESLWAAACGDGVVRVPRRVHVIEMQPTIDEQFGLLKQAGRRAVRRAAKNDVEIRVDTRGELIENHHELYLRSIDRWASHQREPVALARARARRRDPISKLETMHTALGEHCVVVAAFVDGRPAASMIVLLGETSRYTRGATDPDAAGSVGASEAMHWRAIELVHEFGSSRYHLGESGWSSGLSRFKEKLGATPREHHEFRFERVPITRTSDAAKSAVKRVIGFEDT